MIDFFYRQSNGSRDSFGSDGVGQDPIFLTIGLTIIKVIS
jgi:hypothetical protein